jgi:hypothetical protein
MMGVQRGARTPFLRGCGLVETDMAYAAALLLGLGGFLCCANFYLSFLRYPCHRLRGGTKEDYKWVSGIPLFGSLFVAVALLKFWSVTPILIPSVLLIVIDTGGLHWFIGTVLFFRLSRRSTSDEQAKRGRDTSGNQV